MNGYCCCNGSVRTLCACRESERVCVCVCVCEREREGVEEEGDREKDIGRVGEIYHERE